MFSINYQSRQPIYEQLYNNVIRLLSLGVLQPEQQLPPVRQLASQLGVNPNTVSKAYKNLENDGIIYSVVGKGSFIMPDKSVINTKKLDVLNNINQYVKTAMDFGIQKNEIIDLVENIYTKGVNGL